jgi:dienelactone hydrolase
MKSILRLTLCLGLLWTFPAFPCRAAVPNDSRLEPLKDLDGYFPFDPPATKEQWAARAERVRRQIQVAMGLWPMPTRTPLNAVIHGRIEREDYTVEKVYFESLPGFFVTGNLYRPKNRTGKVPGVLCPHGHWPQGRFMDAGVDGVRKQIVTGAERFEEGGRSPLQARSVGLARLGCIVFHYDMIGYADSTQLSFELAHRFAKQRPEMNSPENWGLFSPQAEAHLQSIMGLQTWNSIRALDFLLTLPEVDPKRIAVTGASGGGTQTMLLAALDDRVALSFPAVMVSTAMQGGCTCENSCLLRVNTGNVEFAALFAPKPQGMNTANDWTREMSTKGFPQLQQLYALLGASNHVTLVRGEHFPHNYNYVTRAAMYSWVNRHFKLGHREPIVEEDYRRLTTNEMTVWDETHPKPPGGPDFERGLVRWLTTDAQRQLAATHDSPDRFRAVCGPALEVLIGRTPAEAGQTEWIMGDKSEHGNHLIMRGRLRNTTHHEELPVVFLHPKQWNGQTVVWLDGAGKEALFDRAGEPREEIRRLVDAGATVMGVDLLFQGEFNADGKPVTQTRRVKNPREAAAYTFGYNHALFAQRVHDILTVVQFIRGHERRTRDLVVAGFNGAGPLVAAARAVAGGAIDRAAVDTGGFRFGAVRDLHDVNFLPGGAKYGDLPGMLALNAPGRLWLAGEDAAGAEFVSRLYRAAGAQKELSIHRGEAHPQKAAVEWMLDRAAN